MITDQVILAIEKSLDTTFDAHVVPEREAYPTSGYKFIRVSGTNTLIVINEGSIRFTVNFMVQCSIRTRDFLKQHKQTPYFELVDLQERCFLHLLTDQGVQTDLYGIAENISVIERVKSNSLNTTVQTVTPDFYGSDDFSSTREAGYLLTQHYSAPSLIVPMECLELPAPLNLAE